MRFMKEGLELKLSVIIFIFWGTFVSSRTPKHRRVYQPQIPTLIGRYLPWTSIFVTSLLIDTPLDNHFDPIIFATSSHQIGSEKIDLVTSWSSCCTTFFDPQHCLSISIRFFAHFDSKFWVWQTTFKLKSRSKKGSIFCNWALGKGVTG